MIVVFPLTMSTPYNQFVRRICRHITAIGSIAISTCARGDTSNGFEVSTPAYSSIRMSGLVAA